VHAHVQRLVSVVKTATVLEECATEDEHCVVLFLWAKGLHTKDIHKEMFPVYGWKCLSREAVRNKYRNSLVDVRKSQASQMMPDQM
jgi:hypothetical protein